LKAGIDARIEELSTKTAEIMAKFTKSYGSIISPTLKLQKSIFQLSSVLQDALDPPVMRAIREISKPRLIEQISEFQSSQNKLFQSMKIALPGASIAHQIANMESLALPRNDYASTIGAITKQMSFISPRVGDALKMTQPRYLNEDYFLKGLKLPGFEMTARAGLGGLASKALSAKVLSQYDEPTDDENSIDAYEITRSIISSLDEIPEDNAEAIIEFAKSVPDRISLANPTHVGLFFQFLALVVVVVSLYSQTLDTSESHLEQLVERVEKIQNQHHQEILLQESRYKYDRILSARYHLREGPSKETTSITILNADRIVKVIDTKENWAYVSVYPYGGEPELKGWVYRYGLKPLILKP